jgi:putative toxin-antitoxin system antitoxin component (TIGR02293 family)
LIDDSTAYSYIDAIVDLLGGTTMLGSDSIDRDQLFSAARDGLPPESLSHLTGTLSSSDRGSSEVANWVEDRLASDSVSQDKLCPETSEMMLRIASLLAALIGLYGDMEKAIEFLLTPHRQLDGNAPVQAIFSASGVQAVNDLVLRGLTGMPA